MRYETIQPGIRLANYVKCYYIYESDSIAAFTDTVFPSGCMELIFNLGAGHWQTSVDGNFINTPPVELWGQIIGPLPIRSIGKNTMLGVRFFPSAAAYFFPEKIDLLNNQVADAGDIIGKRVRRMHSRLQETTDWAERIRLVEELLHGLLSRRQAGLDKAVIIGDVMRELGKPDLYENISHLAGRYGITSRYLQKLFLQYTGLTPKLYSKINRFQQSLALIGRKNVSLTSIAYDCGYFDQSHFIREFKSFTGHTPSGYLIERSPVTEAMMNP